MATHQAFILFHYVAGLSSLCFGAAALVSRKGSYIHAKSGFVFAVSMLLMLASAAYLEALRSEAANTYGTIFAGYLIATSWMTVKRKQKKPGVFEFNAMLVALVVGGLALSLGLKASHNEIGTLHNQPAGLYYFFAGFAVFCALFDLRMILRGGLSGAQRIARHLWRMCFALLMAAGSFFLGQQKLFPEFVREHYINVVPVIAVLLVMIYWLIRLLFKNRKNINSTGNSNLFINDY
ncbi:MAG: hypothetical protein MJA83_00745 [Gammaproteobacteria bacterium]|nr:hypothetical protein [Gammaproteobacteria bacterium]